MVQEEAASRTVKRERRTYPGAVTVVPYGSSVRVNYQDILGGSYSHDWEVDPLLYQGLRTIGYRDVSDLVDIVERISYEGIGKNREENSG